jgi:hypothetical protein
MQSVWALAHPLVLGHEGAGEIADGPRRSARGAKGGTSPNEMFAICVGIKCPAVTRRPLR